jgi:hypothetical protein
MRIFLKRLTAALALIFLTVLAPSGRANDVPGFVVMQADAYAHYREAVFYTRTGNTAVAGLALDEFIVKWAALVEAYADNPPADYAGGADWKNTLQGVLTRAETGLDVLDSDDPETAKDAIGPIRGILGDLRRRNNIVTYSDHVNALGAAMDVLARYRKEVKDLGDAEAVAMVREQAAIVEALFEKCRDQAARKVATDPEFKRLVDGAAESMGKLLESLETGDILLYRIGIGELRSYERIMFLRFG